MSNKIVERMRKALLNAEHYQGIMGTYMAKIKILLQDCIDLSETVFDKETFAEELDVVETTDGFCFLFEEKKDINKHNAPLNIPVHFVIEHLLKKGKINYNEFIKLSI